METEEINKLYRIWNSLMKMMQDRDYFVPDELLCRSQMDLKQILNESPVRTALNTELAKQDAENSKILLYFDDNPKVTVPVISKIAQKMHAERLPRCVLIGQSSITSSASQAIAEIRSHFVIEFFEEKELVSGLVDMGSEQYMLVLDHREKEEFLQRYQIKETQVPKMEISDPVARYYGLLRGEILKIIKNTEASGKFVTYRVGV